MSVYVFKSIFKNRYRLKRKAQIEMLINMYRHRN